MTTTRVDFYQLSRDPVDVTVAKLARKVSHASVATALAAGRGGLPRQRHGRRGA